MSTNTQGARMRRTAAAPQAPGHHASESLLGGRLALRPPEAAAALGISVRKLLQLTADETAGVPHFRIGRTVLFPVDELRRWLAERTQKKD